MLNKKHDTVQLHMCTFSRARLTREYCSHLVVHKTKTWIVKVEKFNTIKNTQSPILCQYDFTCACQKLYFYLLSINGNDKKR